MCLQHIDQFYTIVRDGGDESPNGVDRSIIDPTFAEKDYDTLYFSLNTNNH